MENIFATDLIQTLYGNLPFFMPVIVGLIISIIDLVWKEEEKDVLVYLAIVGFVITIVFLWRIWFAEGTCKFLEFPVSKMSIMILLIVSILSILILLFGQQYYSEEGKNIVSFIVHFLFAAFGVFAAIATSNLIIIFASLAITSIALTFLLKKYGYFKNEVIYKKFWIYAFTTDLIFCFGAAFFYGAAGSFNISQVGDLVGTINEFYTGKFFNIAVVFMGISLMAKMAVIPFHSLNIEISSRGSLPVVIISSIFLRTAVMFIFLKIFAPLVNMWAETFQIPFVALAVLTMTWANFAAIKTKDINVMLTYSAIAHVGYFLVLFPSMLVENSGALTTVIIFIIAFSIIHLGAFSLLQLFLVNGSLQAKFENLDGLGKRNPWIAVVFSLFLFALAGAPPLITFLARLMLLKEVSLSGDYFVLGALLFNMALSVFYYVRPVARLFLIKETKSAISTQEINFSFIIVIVFSALIALYLGLQPASFINWIYLSVSQ